MALSPYMMRMMGAQMGARPGTISGLTQPMSLGVQPIMPLMGQQSTMPVMNAGVPEDSWSKARRAISSVMDSAPKGIDPNVEAVLARKEKRLADQESQIEEGGSVWDKLGRFSAALLANESPSFAVGLGQSINATLADEQRRRDAAMQRRSAIQESRDELEMERIRQAGAGRKQAMEEFKLTADLVGSMGLEDLRSAQAAVERAKLNPDPQMRALELREAELKLRKIQSEIDANNRSNRGGGRPSTDVEARADRAELDKLAARYRGVAARYNAALQRDGSAENIEDQKIVQDYLSARAELEGMSSAFERRYGSTPYIGGRNPSVGTLQVGNVRPTGGRSAASPSTTGWSAVQF